MDQHNDPNTGYQRPVGTSAPPTQAVPLAVPAAQSSWPTVIGIIAIVFGAVAVLTTVGSLASKKLFHSHESADSRTREAMQALEARWASWTLPSSIFAAVLAGVLLYAGILLLRRRRSCVRIFRLWAVIKIMFVLVASVITYFTMQETMAALSSGTPGMGSMGRMQQGFVFFVVLITILWGCALPIFLLLWFARTRVQEQIAQWR